MSVSAQSATQQAASLQRLAASSPAPRNQSLRLLNEVLETSQDVDNNSSSHETSWGEVINSIESAQDEYSKKRGVSGANSIHNKKSLITTLETLTEMIPDQDGLSVLRGGLKLLFKLVQRRTENRERIMAAFQDVPVTFSQACEALTTHPSDTPLRESVEQLFNALVEEIPKLVTILLRAHKGSFHSRIFKQHPEHESSVISASLDAVSKASQRVWDRVRTLVDKTVVETLDVTRGVGICVQQTQQSVQVIRESIACVQETQQRIDTRGTEQHAQTLAALSDVMDSKIRHATSQLDIRLHELQSMIAVSLNASRQLPAAQSVPIGNNLPQVSWPAKEPCYLRHGQQQEGGPETAPESRQSLYDKIYFTMALPEPVTFANDIGQVIRATNEMECQDSEPLEKAGWLLVLPRFQAWIKPTGQSDLILVHGYLGSLTTSKISALSVLCAMFVSVRHSPDLVLLHHFCGLHSRHGDPGSGPVAMLRSLVCQLLLNLNQGCKQAGQAHIPPEVIVAAAHGELAGWCALFRALFYALPTQSVVYCIVDGIAEFETLLDDWDAQVCDVVNFLLALSRETRKGPVLKILLTTAQRSISVYKHLSPERQVWLCSENRLP